MFWQPSRINRKVSAACKYTRMQTVDDHFLCIHLIHPLFIDLNILAAVCVHNWKRLKKHIRSRSCKLKMILYRTQDFIHMTIHMKPFLVLSRSWCQQFLWNQLYSKEPSTSRTVILTITKNMIFLQICPQHNCNDNDSGKPYLWDHFQSNLMNVQNPSEMIN